MRAFAALFGLDPSSRSKRQVEKEAEDDLAEFLAG
jgi:hypothetical protein